MANSDQNFLSNNEPKTPQSAGNSGVVPTEGGEVTFKEVWNRHPRSLSSRPRKHRQHEPQHHPVRDAQGNPKNQNSKLPKFMKRVNDDMGDIEALGSGGTDAHRRAGCDRPCS